MKGEVLLPAVTFLVAFEEGAAGKRKGGRGSQLQGNCRSTTVSELKMSERETKVTTPEALAQTSRSSPSPASIPWERVKQWKQRISPAHSTD
ncbi:hypothetical protein QQF64_002030 [Cirrhinus molitorella]|uniref:Uncharacterized protein n=1 Tax=Cirrhinus molitorella TaxID=172907 RepID=A0ABR3MNY7_9TELE